MRKITKCTIGPYPKNMWDEMPKVKVEFDDGTKETLFEFYPDEISFNESEFIGLAEQEARELRHNKDVKYLRS